MLTLVCRGKGLWRVDVKTGSRTQFHSDDIPAMFADQRFGTLVAIDYRQCIKMPTRPKHRIAPNAIVGRNHNRAIRRIGKCFDHCVYMFNCNERHVAEQHQRTFAVLVYGTYAGSKRR